MNCTPVAATGVGVVELLVMVTVVVTFSPAMMTPSMSVSSGVRTVDWMAVKVSLAMLAPVPRRRAAISGRGDDEAAWKPRPPRQRRRVTEHDPFRGVVPSWSRASPISAPSRLALASRRRRCPRGRAAAARAHDGPLFFSFALASRLQISY